MLEGSAEDKWDALIRYVNNGIDIYHMMLGGVTWPPRGGHGEGRKLPAVFAAQLLNDAPLPKPTLAMPPPVTPAVLSTTVQLISDGSLPLML